MRIPAFPLVNTSYLKAQQVQTSISRKLLDLKKVDAKIPASKMALLAYEMGPVYTLGKRQTTQFQRQLMNLTEMEVIKTTRGGHTTFHGPGQVVIYPILDLQTLGLKVRDYIAVLEQSVIDLLHKYEIPAERRCAKGLNGVFLKDMDMKIASVGVHVQRNITTHGLSLNVDVPTKYFENVVSCNLPTTQMVSMSKFAPIGSTKSVCTDLMAGLAEQLHLEMQLKSIAEAEQLVNQN